MMELLKVTRIVAVISALMFVQSTAASTDGDHDPSPDLHMDMGGMTMYFHASSHSQILFKPWMTHNWQQMLGSCVGIVLIAALYEGLKVGRELLQHRLTSMNRVTSEVYPVTTLSDTSGTRSSSELFVGKNNVKSSILSANHIVQTLLHVVQVWISFCLMLVFMTYNIWLCLSVTLGAAVGYFAFAWLRSSTTDSNEHCN